MDLHGPSHVVGCVVECPMDLIQGVPILPPNMHHHRPEIKIDKSELNVCDLQASPPTRGGLSVPMPPPPLGPPGTVLSHKIENPPGLPPMDIYGGFNHQGFATQGGLGAGHPSFQVPSMPPPRLPRIEATGVPNVPSVPVIVPGVKEETMKVKAPTSFQSMAGLPAKMLELGVSARLSKLDELSRMREEELSGHQRAEKRRLMRLEKNRRAASISRERKKRYIRSLEERSLIMAKHLAALEMENNHLRQLLANYSGGAVQVPPPLVPPADLGIQVTPPSSPTPARRSRSRRASEGNKSRKRKRGASKPRTKKERGAPETKRIKVKQQVMTQGSVPLVPPPMKINNKGRSMELNKLTSMGISKAPPMKLRMHEAAMGVGGVAEMACLPDLTASAGNLLGDTLPPIGCGFDELPQEFNRPYSLPPLIPKVEPDI